MKFGRHVHVPHRIHCIKFGDPLIHLAPSSGHGSSVGLSVGVTEICKYGMGCCLRHVCSPQVEIKKVIPGLTT